MKYMERKENRAIFRHGKKAAGCLFVIYLILLVYLLFFSERMGRTQAHGYSYNLVLFDEIHRYLRYWRIIGLPVVFMNLAGNIIAFIPFGILVPVLFRFERNLFGLAGTAFLFSLLVETVQLLTQRGSFDVDDLLLNTLGGIIGYLVFCGMRRIAGKKKVV